MVDLRAQDQSETLRGAGRGKGVPSELARKNAKLKKQKITNITWRTYRKSKEIMETNS